jgi:beta-phosphoglucomutase
MSKKKYKAFIFDMDGVIVDNTKFHYEAFEKFCYKYEKNISHQIYDTYINSRTNESIMTYLFGENITQHQIESFCIEKETLYRELYTDYIVPANGLLDLLKRMVKKNIPIALASNAPMTNIDFVIDRIGIRSVFDVIVNAKMVNKGKPAPDIYLKTSELLNVTKEECLIFEDSLSGIKAANLAGIEVVALSTTYPESKLENVKFVCQDFTDSRILELI